MKVTGIVTEYNPFHNGHIHHIQETKKLTNCDVLVAVMSGHFVQRGEPAIIDKWQRTKTALLHGVDLVIELPYIFSNQSAQQFADGAIQSLALAKVDTICFGSESNNLEELQEIAQMSIQVNRLKENLKTGMGFPKAYGLLAGSFYSNDILGIAYLKAITNTNIKPYTIQRTNFYNDISLDSSIASATAIRTAIKDNKDVKAYTPQANSLEMSYKNTIEIYYSYIRNLLLTLPKSYLSTIFLMDEGIENHLKQKAFSYSNYRDFLENSVTRRYSRTRIQRTLISLLMQITKTEQSSLPKLNHIRVLGFSETGRKYLKTLKEDQDLTIATCFGQIPLPYRNIEEKAYLLYTANMPEPIQLEFRKRELKEPVIL